MKSHFSFKDYATNVKDLDLTTILTFHSVSLTDFVPQLNVPKETMKREGGGGKQTRIGCYGSQKDLPRMVWYPLSGQQQQGMEQLQKHSKIPTRLPLKCSSSPTTCTSEIY